MFALAGCHKDTWEYLLDQELQSRISAPNISINMLLSSHDMQRDLSRLIDDRNHKLRASISTAYLSALREATQAKDRNNWFRMARW